MKKSNAFAFAIGALLAFFLDDILPKGTSMFLKYAIIAVVALVIYAALSFWEKTNVGKTSN